MQISALEHKNRELERALAAEQASKVLAFQNQQVALRGYVQLLRSTSGKGAGDKWPNFIVRRALAVPALKQSDVGRQIDIGGDFQDELELKGGSKGGVAASKHRLVRWGTFEPQPVTNARIVAVDDETEMGGTVEIETKDGLRVRFSNPTCGLVTDVLGFMRFGASRGGFKRQDLFKPTDVSFEDEEGVDMAGDGGLSQDMYASFWRAVVDTDLGLFESISSALPAADASEEHLELLGLFLCKTIVDEKLIGRGLCPFLFEFLLEQHTVRSFDASQPMREQVRRALAALAQFDPTKAKSFHSVLDGLERGGEDGDDDPLSNYTYTVGMFMMTGDPTPVTAANIEQTLVDACKMSLWTSREEALLAMRRGFSTQTAITKEPIDLSLILRPFSTPDLMLLVQGRDIDAKELVGSCIEWPEASVHANLIANFPEGSTTPQLLRELLSAGAVSSADFLHWATGRREVPFGGLAATEGGKIKLRFNDLAAKGRDEAKWLLPQAQTCVHSVSLGSFTRREILLKKLQTAIAHREEGFQRDD